MNNIIGITISIGFILLVLGIAALLAKYTASESELSRKTVHILVGNWVFITPLFDNLWALLFVPFTFVIVNWISKEKQVFKAMERQDDSWGTVYYAISILVLSLLSWFTKMPILLYAGVLIMAYGDGLAALIGQKYGTNTGVLGIQGKSWAGSLTVSIVSGIVTYLSLFILTPGVSNGHRIALSLVTAIFATLIELSGTNGVDNLTLPIGVSLFIGLSLLNLTSGYFIYLALMIVILLFSFIKAKITLDGLIVAFLTGAAIYILGNPWLGMALIAFFILGTVITRFGPRNQSIDSSSEQESAARDWKQVIANSLPAVILATIYYFTDNLNVLMISFAIFSAATSDTFASELGTKTNNKVFSIINLKEVPKGLSGGITISGLFFSLIGSFIISLLAFPLFGIQGLLINTVLGLLGSIIDSILGATIQKKYLNSEGELQDEAEHPNQEVVKGFKLITNSHINFLALSIVAIIGLSWVVF